MLKIIEYLGSIAGILGAGLLALNNDYSGYGFISFMLSNICFIIIGFKCKLYGLLVMQVFFTLTSIVGIYTWLL